MQIPREARSRMSPQNAVMADTAAQRFREIFRRLAERKESGIEESRLLSDRVRLMNRASKFRFAPYCRIDGSTMPRFPAD
jgi:hypothetical protein